MSDIQRYEAYVVKDCPSGCWEAEHREGHYVKYDDHIEKINEKCRRTAIVTAESWNKQVEMLKARIKELEK